MIGALPVLACGFACGVGTLALVHNSPAGSLAGSSTFGSVVLVTTGWVAIGTGVGESRRRPGNRFAILLTAAGFAWFMAEWNNPGAGSSIVFTLGLVLGAACPPLVAHAALSYPSGRLGSVVEGAAVATGYVAAVLVVGLGPALVFAPGDQGCAQCSSNLVAVGDDAGLVASLQRTGVRLGLAAAAVLGVLALSRVVRATPAGRRVMAPVLVPLVIYLGAVVATFAHSVERGYLSNDPIDRRLWLVQGCALVAIALAVVAGWVRARRARASVAAMVVELAAAPPAGALRDALASTLRDAELLIAYPLADGRHVDARGAPADTFAAPGRATTALVRDGETVALIIHRDDLLGDPRHVEAVASAARLAFENERLQAEARAELAELRTSRSRIVAAADAERRHLERDLHDGAQQRLVGLTLAMRLVRTRLESDGHPERAEKLASAEAELRRAVDELRELASGIHPAVLTDYGLRAAIEALAERALAPLRLAVATGERFPAAAEAAAYLVVAEAARTGPVQVAIVRCDTTLVVEVDMPAEPPVLVDVEDRVSALGGTISRAPTPDGARIRAEIPCG